MARVDLFPAQVPIGRATVNGVEVPIYAKPELLRALRAVQASVNAVESGLTALEISNVPAGGIAATNVQDALNELDTEKVPASRTVNSKPLSANVVLTPSDIGAQASDATLTALAALVTASDNLIYATGVDTFALTTFTAFGRSLVDDANAGAARTTLGLGSIATQAASGVAITGGAIDSTTVGATTPSTGKFTTVEATSTVKTGSMAVGALPAAGTAGAGARAYVTDATSATFMALAVGGGANKVPVVSDGTNWYIG